MTSMKEQNSAVANDSKYGDVINFHEIKHLTKRKEIMKMLLMSKFRFAYVR